MKAKSFILFSSIILTAILASTAVAFWYLGKQSPTNSQSSSESQVSNSQTSTNYGSNADSSEQSSNISSREPYSDSPTSDSSSSTSVIDPSISKEDIDDFAFKASAKAATPSGTELTTLDVSQLKSMNNKIGFGYNVAGGKAIYDPEAVNVLPILDQTSAALKESIYIDPTTSQSAYSIKTDKQSELMESMGQSVSAGITANVSVVNTNIDSLFEKTTSFSTTQRELYELYSMRIKKGRYLSRLTVDQLRKNLDPTFQSELYSVDSESSAMSLFNNYGTHLIRGYTVGGIMELSNYYATKNASYSRQTKDSLQTQISTIVGSYGGGATGSLDQEYGNLENKNECVSNYHHNSYGGNATSAFSIDQLFTYGQTLTEKGYVYGEWINSINEGTNLTIVSIPSQTPMLPLWNLLPLDSSYNNARENLINAYIKNCKAAYEEYCEDHPDCEVTTLDVEEEEFNGEYQLKGYTERKVSGYASYYETENSFNQSGLHVQLGSRISLNVETNDDIRNISWSLEGDNKNIGHIDNEHQGLLYVYPNSKADSITVVMKVRGVVKASLKFSISNINTDFNSGGTGTEEDPYLISTKEEFVNYINNGCDKYFDKYVKLINDIDVSGETFKPAPASLTGGFDGNYCTITGLTIEEPSGTTDSISYCGLFAQNNGTIENVRLVSPKVKVGNSTHSTYCLGNEESKKQGAVNCVGILCGKNYSDAKIENCTIAGTTNNHAKVSLTVNDVDKPKNRNYVGALCGVNNGDISLCSIECVDVNGEIDCSVNDCQIAVGGLVGKNEGKIENSEAVSLNIESYLYNTNGGLKCSQTGGLVGKLSASGNVTRTLSLKNAVKSMADRGWWVGQHRYQNVGGLIGEIDSNCSLEDCIVNQLLALSAKDGDVNRSAYFVGHLENCSPTFKNCQYQTPSSDIARLNDEVSSDIKASSSALSIGTAGLNNDEKVWTTSKNNGGLRINIPEIESISVSFEKEDFIVGEVFDPGLVSVDVTFTNGKTEQVNSYIVNGLFDKLNSPTTSASIKVTTYGKDYNVDISVVESKAISLSVDLENTKTDYFIDEKVNASDIKVYANFDGGNEPQLVATKNIVVETSDFELGKNLVTIKAYGFETSYVATFSKREIDFIDASLKQNQTWHEGDTVQASDINVVVTYKDGSTEKADNDDVELVGNLIVKGNNTIKVCYGGYFMDNITVQGI